VTIRTLAPRQGRQQVAHGDRIGVSKPEPPEIFEIDRRAKMVHECVPQGAKPGIDENRLGRAKKKGS